MQDVDIERPTNTPSAKTSPAPLEHTEPQSSVPSKTASPATQKPHPWALILGLTGLLGAVWAVAIVSRYQHILPG